jgi:hypothetical protein
MKIGFQNINLATENIILLVLFVIATVYLLWELYERYIRTKKEHFTADQPATSTDTVQNPAEYQARMTVMKVFDTVLKRKPTTDEIDKYSKISNEQDILIAILADYNVKSTGLDGLAEGFVTPPPPSMTTPPVSVTTPPASVTTPTPSVQTPPHVSTPAPVPNVVPLAPTPTVQEETTPFTIPRANMQAIEFNLKTLVETVTSLRALLLNNKSSA